MEAGAAGLAALMVLVSWAAGLAAAAASASLATSPVPFQAGYMPLFGGDNLVRSPGGRSVRLKLDRRTGKKLSRMMHAVLLSICSALFS